MRRLMAFFVVCLLTASCSSNTIHLIPARELPRAVYGKGTQAANGRTQSVTIYLIRGKQLAAITRTGPSSSRGADLVMHQLLDGPNADEKADGLSTTIPGNTELLSVNIDANGVANVNLSQQFERAADPDTQLLRLAQVVYSLGDLPDVITVHFLFEGVSQSVLDENGRRATIVSKSRYSRFAPEQFGSTPINPCSLVESLGQCAQETAPVDTSAPNTAP